MSNDIDTNPLDHAPIPTASTLEEVQARHRARERREEKLQLDAALGALRTEARLYVATARYTERLKTAAPGMPPDKLRIYAAEEAIKDADALLEALK